MIHSFRIHRAHIRSNGPLEFWLGDAGSKILFDLAHVSCHPRFVHSRLVLFAKEQEHEVGVIGSRVVRFPPKNLESIGAVRVVWMGSSTSRTRNQIKINRFQFYGIKNRTGDLENHPKPASSVWSGNSFFLPLARSYGSNQRTTDTLSPKSTLVTQANHITQILDEPNTCNPSYHNSNIVNAKPINIILQKPNLAGLLQSKLGIHGVLLCKAQSWTLAL